MRHVTCDRCGDRVHPYTNSVCEVKLGHNVAVEVDLCDSCQFAIRTDIVRYIEGDPVSQGSWAGEARWRS